MTALLLIEF